MTTFASVANPGVCPFPVGDPAVQVYKDGRAAGLWQYLGPQYVANDAAHSVDPALLKFIWNFDPDFEHLWCRQLYKSPGGTYALRVYHTIARHVAHPIEGASIGEPARVLLPADRVARGPVYVAHVLHGPRKKNGAPPAFRPFGWREAKNLEEQFWAVRKRAQGIEESKKERGAVYGFREANLRAAREEAREGLRDDWKILKRCIDEGRFHDPIPDPKPFVFVGRAASPAA